MLRSHGSVGSHRCWTHRLRRFQSHQEPSRVGASRCSTQRDSCTSLFSRNRLRRPGARFGPRLRLVIHAMATPAPAVMVNSCTGKMGCAAAEAVLRAGLPFVPMTITGEPRAMTEKKKGMTIGPDQTHVEFVGIEDREERLQLLKQQYSNLIIVDFTLPSCVNENGALYGKLGLNFVMGTTGGDREKLLKDVRAAGVYAVIAPQMGKQIVAFQAMLKYMSDRFPGAFSGYSLTVTESHQATKVDTSGTAKAVVESFIKLGANLDPKGITMIRDAETQIQAIGVPEDALHGHAYHTYHLSSSDETVNFEFQHNVAGRTFYAEGTVDAVLFLQHQIQQRSSKKLFNMIDVLEAGSMR